MKKVLLMVLSIGALALALPTFVSAEEAAEATIEGWVETWEESDEGETLSVYIDVEGTWYIVENDGKGAELLNYVGQQVRATGSVTPDPEDSSLMRISVKSFSVIEEEEEAPEDPYTDPEPTGRH
jgi:hypothetical protein